ncbi:Serpentine Receptor, class T [Aphelenchoides fujianensis]|nr:Serpentine Receptor, class T [Aphelenchoides fujianensis]
MELLLFDRPTFERMYNCSLYDVDEIPFTVRRKQAVGVVYLVGWSIFTPLYFVCLCAMWPQLRKRQAIAYRLMFALGCVHLIGEQVAGLVAGLFALNGVVYCSCPLLNYVTSAIALGAWVMSTLYSLIIGFNRCLVLHDRSLNERVFGGWRLVFWIGIPLLYGLAVMTFTDPFVYNSIIGAYVTNPHLGYRDDPQGLYHSTHNRIHNTVIFFAEIILYFNMIRLYGKMSAAAESRTKLKYEKQVYIPALFIGGIHFITGFLYVLLDTVPVPPILGLVGTLTYWLSQGLPAVVYLVFNQTIRSTALRALKGKDSRVSTAHTVNVSNSQLTPTHE